MAIGRVIHVSSLGHNGRFGNQLFQYCFAKAYALKHRAALQVPADWIGRRVFKIPEPGIVGELPLTGMDAIPVGGRVNVDLLGWFQFDRALAHYSVAQAKQWLSFLPRWEGRRGAKVRAFYAAAHLRRGDLHQYADRWCLVERASYVRAFARYGVEEKDVVWVTEETQRPDPELDAEGLGMLTDFFTLINADVVFRANSSFSWWGAALSGARVYSPVVEDRVGLQDVEFAEGNWPRMIDMKHHAGACVHTDLHLKAR